MSKVYIADREVHGIAELSRKESARFKRRPTAWHAPYPPRVEPKVANTEAEADDTLILRATIAAALRKNGNAP